MTLHVMAWPATSKNPYIADLYSEIVKVRPDVEVTSFPVGRAWMSKPDIVHVHWPEAAIHPPSLAKATAKTTAALTDLRVLKARGAKVVWTCHNLKSHDIPHRRLDHFMRNQFNGMVDGVIHLSEVSQRGLATHPQLSDKPSTVVALAQTVFDEADLPTKQDARLALGIDDELPVLALIGMIRPYKNVPRLINAFSEMSTPARLVIGGNPLDEAMAAEIDRAAAGVANLTLDARWLSDDEVINRIRASDVVVLPYTEVHNSSVAVQSVSLARPVAVRPQGSMRDFVINVGSDWAYSIDEPLTGAVLDNIVDWLEKPRRESPDLSKFDPVETAKRTVEFYEQILVG